MVELTIPASVLTVSGSKGLISAIDRHPFVSFKQRYGITKLSPNFNSNQKLNNLLFCLFVSKFIGILNFLTRAFNCIYYKYNAYYYKWYT